MEEYCHFKNDDAAAAGMDSIKEMIRSKAAECNLDEDVPESEAENLMIILASCIILLLILKNMQISTGLHVLGVPPEGEELVEYLLALTKLDNGKVPSLMKTLLQCMGMITMS